MKTFFIYKGFRNYVFLLVFLFINAKSGASGPARRIRRVGRGAEEVAGLAFKVNVAEMSAAAGQCKVKMLTKDRAKANKVSWAILQGVGVQAGPDVVHVHSPMVGDMFKATAPLEAANNDAYLAVTTIRKRARLSAHFQDFQKEGGALPLTLVQVRQEWLGIVRNGLAWNGKEIL